MQYGLPALLLIILVKRKKYASIVPKWRAKVTLPGGTETIAEIRLSYWPKLNLMPVACSMAAIGT